MAAACRAIAFEPKERTPPRPRAEAAVSAAQDGDEGAVHRSEPLGPPFDSSATRPAQDEAVWKEQPETRSLSTVLIPSRVGRTVSRDAATCSFYERREGAEASFTT